LSVGGTGRSPTFLAGGFGQEPFIGFALGLDLEILRKEEGAAE
jgi:hypothetical protein